MSKQPVIIPKITPCPCGAKTEVVDLIGKGWIYGPFVVMCQRNHTFTKPCGTANRAVHRHNQRVTDQ